MCAAKSTSTKLYNFNQSQIYDNAEDEIDALALIEQLSLNPQIQKLLNGLGIGTPTNWAFAIQVLRNYIQINVNNYQNKLQNIETQMEDNFNINIGKNAYDFLESAIVQGYSLLSFIDETSTNTEFCDQNSNFQGSIIMK